MSIGEPLYRCGAWVVQVIYVLVDSNGKESCPDDGDFQSGAAFDDTLSGDEFHHLLAHWY
jgi:hypothetical protein